jgi:hypothetical protein
MIIINIEKEVEDSRRC